MDRPTTRQDADARSSRLLPLDAFVLPSRRSALDACRPTVEAGATASPSVGPILVTGDAGVGKTWLWRRLEAEAAVNTRWIGVDLTPANSPADLYRLIGHELGFADSCVTPSGRVELIDFLTERQADGQRLTLVIDEAQNLSMPVWEEVRVLANRLDRPGGFSRMVLVGQTSLARRFATRPFAAIEARLAARVHLGPIDADEAAELISQVQPGRTWSPEQTEALHRDAGGNPRRILRKLGPSAAPRKLTADPIEPVTPKLVAPTAAEPLKVERTAVAPVMGRGPLTGPARPPIRVDENMIEVGWSPDDSAAADDADGSVAQTAAAPAAMPGGEEAVHDHYAALQAWREWTENQGRRAQSPAGPVSPVAAPQPAFEDEIEDEDDVDVEEDRDDLPLSRSDRPRVRTEGEQKFAPFGQLFTRMAQSHDSE